MRSLLLAFMLSCAACTHPLPHPEQVSTIVEHQIDRVSSLLDKVEPMARECAKPAVLGNKPCQVFVDAYARANQAVVLAKRAVVLGQDAAASLENLAREGSKLIEAYGALGDDDPDGGV